VHQVGHWPRTSLSVRVDVMSGVLTSECGLMTPFSNFVFVENKLNFVTPWDRIFLRSY